MKITQDDGASLNDSYVVIDFIMLSILIAILARVKKDFLLSRLATVTKLCV